MTMLATYLGIRNKIAALCSQANLSAVVFTDTTDWGNQFIDLVAANPEKNLRDLVMLAEHARTVDKVLTLSEANDLAETAMRQCASVNGEDACNKLLSEVGQVAVANQGELPELHDLFTRKHKGAQITVRRLIGSMSYFARFAMAVTNNSPSVMLLLLCAYEHKPGWLAALQDVGATPGQITAAYGTAAMPARASLTQNAATHPIASTHAVAQKVLSHFGLTSITPAGMANAQVAAAAPAPAAAPMPTVNTNPPAQPAPAPVNTTATAKENTMTTTNTATVSKIAAALSAIPAGPMRDALSNMLGGMASGVTLDDIISADHERSKLAKELEAARKEAESLMASLRAAKSAPTTMALPATQNTSGALPSGKVDWVKAGDVFPQLKGIELMVPSFTWDSAHPDVPAVDGDYVFRKALLLRAVRSIAANERTWLVGHTGSGKTTFVEQIAARLGWPLLRVALDANVDRSALMGRMSLKSDGKGGTVSEWLPGIVERAIAHGYILLLDEIDASHPNSIFALQPVLEGRGLPLLEDGGRFVPMHPMSRIVATGNTAGSGDPSGLYPATRILSAATLDRFAEFIEVPYMTQAEESALIKRVVPGLPASVVTKLAKFGTELRAAFVKQEVPISYSPRRSLSFARAVETYLGLFRGDANAETKAIDLALAGKLVCATPEEFRPRITELARTSLGVSGATANEV